MSGIFGSSSIDRHNQSTLNSYLDSIDPSCNARYCKTCDEWVTYEKLCDDCPDGGED